MGKVAKIGSSINTAVTIKLQDTVEAILLFGQNDEHLKLLRSRLNVQLLARGNELKISGDQTDVSKAEQTFHNLLTKVRCGEAISLVELEHTDLDKIGLSSTNHDYRYDYRYDYMAKLPRQAKPRTNGQHSYVQAISENEITFGIGPAGTGKTHLAVAMAAQFLKERKVKRIILTRPAVEAGEKLGFLPGDVQAKIDPYLRPLYDALYAMLDTKRVEEYLEKGVIEVAPLGFMRGRTLNNAFIILDEAQNTTPEQMKMFLTRMGFNSRVVVTGDLTQTDLPNSVKSGLTVAANILKNIKGITFITFAKSDVVRHPLVARIIKAYEETTS